MEYIDIETWGRKKQYENFISYSNPIFSIGTTVNVTRLVSFCKEKKLSFFSAFLYFVTISVNSVDALKLRLREGRVVRFDSVHPGYVVLCEGDELRTCVTLADTDFNVFYQNTRKDIENTKNRESLAYNETRENDCFYVSCLPWIRFHSLSNPYNLADKDQSSIPRITWGKFYERGNRFIIDVDISAHHALVDGLHAAQFIQILESKLDQMDLDGGIEDER